MCDSFVALGNSTASGNVLLAKSADTEVNEAEHVVRFPRRQHGEGAMVRITHINLPQARETNAIILGKSFWSWGAEIGANEHGVAVGNEAAFSNQKETKDGVVCLDLLRVVLERARTAREGIDIVAHHVETFGQGGNCQMMGNFWFDTGLMIGDRKEAWVVNCAGRHWAARQVKDVMAISNRYQITDDWDLSSLNGGNGSGKANFRQMFADEQREFGCASSERENAAMARLNARNGSITVRDMADTLRDVGEDYEVWRDDRPTRVCMHAGPFESRFWHATGAMVTESGDEGITVWMTGTSATDLSVFKPLFFDAEMPDLGPTPTGTYTPGALWWEHERLHRRAMADYHALLPEIRGAFDPLEDEFFREAETVKRAGSPVKSEFVADCWRRSWDATKTWVDRLERRNYFIQEPSYRAMWDRFNREGDFQI